MADLVVATTDSRVDSKYRRAPADAPVPPPPRPVRRGHREGSLYQRRDGRWVAAVSDGSGRRVCRYRRSRAEADAALADLLKTAAATPPMMRERSTVGGFLLSWLETTARPTVRASTYISYAGIVHQHLIPELGRIRLARLAPQDVQALLDRKLACGLSARRVDYLRGVLQRALNQAIRRGLLVRNPAALARAPGAPRHRIRPLDADEVRRLVAAIRGDRLEALYTLAVVTGMRRGEVLGLRWADVDLDRGMLRVHHAMERLDGTYRLVEPPSSRRRRTIALPGTVLRSLRVHRESQQRERVRAGADWADGGLVFATPLGRPLDATAVTRGLHRHLERSGLRPQRFDDLRHACASLLLAQGVDPRVVMGILGQSRLTLTLTADSHVLPTLTADAAERIDRVLEPDPRG